MVGVFLNLGESFKDDKLNIFRRELEKRMSIVAFNYARERIDDINKIDEMYKESGNIFYFETDVCRKNKNYIRAFVNLITCISTQPSAVYLMPAAPKEIVKACWEQWPNAEVYHFEYDVMKPSRLIPKPNKI